MHRRPAAAIAAIISVLAALGLQYCWLQISTSEPVSNFWPHSGIVVAAATLFLLADGHMQWHGSLTTSQLSAAIVAEGSVMSFLAVGMFTGPSTNLLRAGLWLVAPLLLAATSASLLASLDQLLRRPKDHPSSESRMLRAHRLRIALAVALLAALYLLERQALPDVRP